MNGAILLFLATTAAIGTYVIASCPVEALGLFAVGLTTPLLPVLRGQVVAGGDTPAEVTVGRMTAAVLVLTVSGFAWMIAAPGQVITLVAGAGAYDDAGSTLRVLAIAFLFLTLRFVGQLLLVAEGAEREGEPARLSSG